jgi:hypothetical protein
MGFRVHVASRPTAAESTAAQPLRQRVSQQFRLRVGDDLQASGPDLMAHCPRAGRMCRRGPGRISRGASHLAAEALAEFDTSELATELTAGPKRHGRSQPLLAGHQHSRTRKVAPRSSWLGNSSLMKRSRGSAGVALGSVAIASSLVTMRAQRAFTSAYVESAGTSLSVLRLPPRLGAASCATI